MEKRSKITKVVGKDFNPATWGEHPRRVEYAQPTDECHTTMGAKSMEEVFIPYYDRPGYKTDNEARTSNGKMFKISAGEGQMEERDLGV